MRDQPPRRPSSFGGPGFPFFSRHGIRRRQKPCLGFGHTCHDGLKFWRHGYLPLHSSSLDRPAYLTDRLNTAVGLLNQPAAGLLEGVCQLQDFSLAESRAEDLQPYGELPGDFSTRNRHAWHPPQRSRNRIYISKIHLQRVVRPFPKLERRNRRRGRYDHIHLRKSIAKILGNQRSDFLPLEVI